MGISKGNILVDIRGVAHLSDFGMSRIRHAISRTLTSRRDGGRSRYVAPELEAGMLLSSTEPSDIYSFAMTILALGTGVKPFFDIERDLVAAQHARKGSRPVIPKLIHGLPSNVVCGLEALLQQMWGNNPAKRFNAIEVEDELKGIFDGYQSFQRINLSLVGTISSAPASIALPFERMALSCYPDINLDDILDALHNAQPQHQPFLISQLIELALSDPPTPPLDGKITSVYRSVNTANHLMFLLPISCICLATQFGPPMPPAPLNDSTSSRDRP